MELQTFIKVYETLRDYVFMKDNHAKIFSLLLTHPKYDDIERESEIGVFSAYIYGLDSEKNTGKFIENACIKMDDLLYKDIFNHVKKIMITKHLKKNTITFKFDSRQVRTYVNSLNEIRFISSIFEDFANESVQRIINILKNKKDLPPLIVKGDFQHLSNILNNIPIQLEKLIAKNLVSEIEIQVSFDQCNQENKIYSMLRSIEIVNLDEDEVSIETIPFWKYSFHLIGTPLDNYLDAFFSVLRRAKDMLVKNFDINDATAYEILYNMSFFSLISYETLSSSTRYFTENNGNGIRIPGNDLSKKLAPNNLLSFVALFLTPESMNQLKTTLPYIPYDLTKNIALEKSVSFLSSLKQFAESYNRFIILRNTIRKERKNILRFKGEAKTLIDTLHYIKENIEQSQKIVDRDEVFKTLYEIINKTLDFANRYHNKSLIEKVSTLKSNLEQNSGKYLEKKLLLGYKINGIGFWEYVLDIIDDLLDAVEEHYIKDSRYGRMIEDFRKASHELFSHDFINFTKSDIDKQIIDLIQNRGIEDLST